MKSIIEALNWRYATKEFDTTKKLTNERVTALLDSARLSPSWYGLQPWKFILIEDSALRTKLREVSYNQAQVTDASHFIVFAHKTTLDEAYVDTFINSAAKATGVTPENLSGLKNGIMGFVGMVANNPSPWAANQTHIALGTLLTAAASMETDAAPMGGFDANAYDEILGLKELGLHTAVVCAVGYRSSNDPAQHRPKSRFSLEEVVIKK